MARTAKKKIPIYDNGVLLTADADSLNFTGTGHTGSISGNDVTEDFSGGGSGGGSSNIAFEYLTPTQVGSNVTVDLTALSHTWSATLFISRNGQILQTSAWSRSSTTVTIFNTDAADIIGIQYSFASATASLFLLSDGVSEFLLSDAVSLLQLSS